MPTRTNPKLQRFDPALSQARQCLYRFAALTFVDSRAGSWERMHELQGDKVLDSAATFIRSERRCHAAVLARGERGLEHLDPGQVLERLPASADALNDEYERTFGLLVSSRSTPYESEYIDSKFAFQRSNTLADLNGFYHAFGLTVAAERNERPDHIAIELEFMAHLAAMERRAGENASGIDAAIWRERRAICRSAQARFLTEHLAWWTPLFARLVAREAPGGFYEAAGVFLSALIPAERALLGIAPAQIPGPPAPAEPATMCEGCQLG